MSQLTLDEAATMLRQLVATDTVDLTRIRDALSTWATKNPESLTAQPLVARAARILSTIISQYSLDPDRALEEANANIETAMLAVSASSPVVDQLPDDADRELLPDFLAESAESLAQSECALLQLEADPTDMEAVNTVFRAFHSVKGTSAFLGLPRVTAFAHEAEGLLSRLRDHEIHYTRDCATLALRSVDMIKLLLAGVSTALAGAGVMPVPAEYESLFDALKNFTPDGATNVAADQAVPNNPRNPSAEPAADTTIRVRTDQLDRLISLLGELVMAQYMISGDDGLQGAPQREFRVHVAHAERIVQQLQTVSMSMRTVPFRATFQKLARVVRDTAVKSGKSVHFCTSGDDVEVDRMMVDLLSDPLVHMVRNAVDHGIEVPFDRTASGKAGTGSVQLRAYHASGELVVELSDDGRGLRRDTLVRKAIEKRLIASDDGMSDADVFALVYAPGFSTAEKLTDISGRGVGMDVVRRNLDMIRGRVDIQSQPGAGTTFSMRLPLTAA